MFDIAVTNSQENKSLSQVLAMSLAEFIGDIAMKKPKGFKDITGFEGRYAISKNGAIYSYPKKPRNPNGKILKTNYPGHGYLMVGLSKLNKSKQYLIHRLVAKTFICNPMNKPHVNHKDHNIKNNKIENLEWCSRSENMRFRMKHKKSASIYKGVSIGSTYKSKKFVARITYNGKRISIGVFDKEIDAAIAYNNKAKELYGKFALLNDV